MSNLLARFIRWIRNERAILLSLITAGVALGIGHVDGIAEHLHGRITAIVAVVVGIFTHMKVVGPNTFKEEVDVRNFIARLAAVRGEVERVAAAFGADIETIAAELGVSVDDVKAGLARSGQQVLDAVEDFAGDVVSAAQAVAGEFVDMLNDPDAWPDPEEPDAAQPDDDAGNTTSG